MVVDYPVKRVLYTVPLSTTCSHLRDTYSSLSLSSGRGARSSSVATQICHRVSQPPSSSRGGFFFHLFSGLEERRRVLADIRPEPFSEVLAVPNAVQSRCVIGRNATRLVCDSRFKGCLFSCSGCSGGSFRLAWLWHRGYFQSLFKQHWNHLRELA